MQKTIDGLTGELQKLEREIEKLRTEFRRRTIAVVSVCVLFLAVISAVVYGQLNLDTQIAKAQRQWCPLLEVYGIPDGTHAPNNPFDLRLAERGTQLYQQFCT